MKYFFSFLFVLISFTSVHAQVSDSNSPMPARMDTARKLPVHRRVVVHLVKDTLRQQVVHPFRQAANPGYAAVLRMNPYFHFFARAVPAPIREREIEGKERLFYLMIGMLLFLGMIKTIFGKYLQNLVSVLFRVSLKQKQMREQLQQSTLPSLLLNVFFVLCGGLYISFLFDIYDVHLQVNFWLFLFYCVLALAFVYVAKFLILRLTGWIFNMQEATNTYIFIIFLINKLLGILLLPVLIMMAFSGNVLQSIFLTLSFILIFFAFGFRYISSYGPIRREIKVNPFHFFIYLCAFEIMPLILIYKLLIKFLETSS